MSILRLFQPKVTVPSGSAQSFPTASSYYDSSELNAVTIICAPAAATARQITFTFADNEENVLLTVTKTLAATTAMKVISVGLVAVAGDFVASGDNIAQFMILPPKLRVTVVSAAVNFDISIIGR